LIELLCIVEKKMTMPIEQFLKVPAKTWSTHVKLQKLVNMAWDDAKVYWKWIYSYHYKKHGRGAFTIWFDDLEGEWPLMDPWTLMHHMYYFNQEELAKRGCSTAIKYMKQYDPEQSFVLLVAGGIKGREVVPTQISVVDKNE
jgi:hypothetical protein